MNCRNKSAEIHNMNKIATNKPKLRNKPDKSDRYARVTNKPKYDLFVIRHIRLYSTSFGMTYKLDFTQYLNLFHFYFVKIIQGKDTFRPRLL